MEGNRKAWTGVGGVRAKDGSAFRRLLGRIWPGRRQEARDRTVAGRAASPACNNAPQGFPFAASATSTTQVMAIIGSNVARAGEIHTTIKNSVPGIKVASAILDQTFPVYYLSDPIAATAVVGHWVFYRSTYQRCFPKGDGRPMNNEVHLSRNPLIAMYRLVGLASAFVSRPMARVARWV